MQKRVMITVGGTGGHIFPAISLAQQLSAAVKEIEILFVGGKLDRNRYFEKGAFSHKSIACGSITSKNPFKLMRSGFHILQGIMESRSIIRDFQPQLIVGFGSYHTLPTLVAAKLKSVPIVLHESNSVPGKVNRLIAPYAHATGVLFPQAAQKLKGAVVPVGMPLRPGFRKNSVLKEEALAHYGLEPGTPTLLVFGGSQGAKALNKLVVGALKTFPKKNQPQIIHVTGHQDSVQEIYEQYKMLGIRACVKDFENSMQIAWQAADVALCRAGAGTIAEALEFEVPCLVIPYPYAADNHQQLNGSFLVDTVGGGRMLIEKLTSSEEVAKILADLLQPATHTALKAAMANYKAQGNTRDFCSYITALLESGAL